MQDKTIERYFFFGFLLVVIAFTFFIFRPFFSVLVVSASLAVVFYPLYRWLLKKLKGIEWLSALITVFIFIIILLGPIFLLGKLVFNQSEGLYHQVVSGDGIDPLVAKLEGPINRLLPAGVNFNIAEKAAGLVTFISDNIAKVFTATVTTLFSFLLLFLSLFYFLRDGERFKRWILILSPLSDKDDKEILTRLGRAVNGVVKGYLLIGLLQGILAGIGLAIFGVPYPALWGVLAGVASLVPSIGTAIISIPVIIYLFATGDSTAAIGYAVWAGIIVGTVDNFLNPIIVGNKINIPPLFVLFSVLGGVATLGPVGLLVGPLTLSLLYALVLIYRHGFKNKRPVSAETK